MGFQVISSGNLVLGIVLGGVLQQLWGTIRAMQTIVLLVLIAVPFPPFANIFFIACGQIASIDILHGESFYEKFWTFIETGPINNEFLNFEIDNQNFFLNSGSFTIMMVVIFIYMMFKLFVNKSFIRLLYCFPKVDIIKDIGAWAYEEEYKKKYKYAILIK